MREKLFKFSFCTGILHYLFFVMHEVFSFGLNDLKVFSVFAIIFSVILGLIMYLMIIEEDKNR